MTCTVPATESCTPASVTTTASGRPSVPVTMLRSLPTTFFPAWMCCPETGTPIEDLTL
nr:hypothetical protein [Streptomyces sp. CS131]